MFGSVKGVDPETGHNFDDTKRYIDALALSEEDRRKVFEVNVRRVYPRLDAALKAKGRKQPTQDPRYSMRSITIATLIFLAAMHGGVLTN